MSIEFLKGSKFQITYGGELETRGEKDTQNCIDYLIKIIKTEMFPRVFISANNTCMIQELVTYTCKAYMYVPQL